MSKNVIVTGGCGFVGHHLVEHLLKNTDWKITIFDKLTYASSGLSRVKDINVFDDNRVFFYAVDFSDNISDGIQKELQDTEYIFHLGAESHVDNSIIDPVPFIKSNVLGTHYMLWFAKSLPKLKAFNMFSTDETFGPAPMVVFYKEWDRSKPGNPYAATKSASEDLSISYQNTYKIPVFITKCMNVFGERQHQEKFIPLCIKKILNNEEITIHSDESKKISGTRHWIHARNVADALLFLMDKFESGEKYNIVGEEISNLDIAKKISIIMGKPLRYKMVDFHSSRPGHDLRYSLDGSKMRQMGWSLPKDLDYSLEKTVKWTLKNKQWL